MNVIVACEKSEAVTQALRAKGVEAWSCDLLPSEIPDYPYHIQNDIRNVIDFGWDMMIAHPDCTYLASSGLHWNKRRPERQMETQKALDFVRWLFAQWLIPQICVENPIGCIPTQIDFKAFGFQKQVIQPYQFGEDASKATVLFLKGLPKLIPTKYIEPRIVNGKKRWGNQTDSGQNKLAPSDHRKADRARTYQGIANAMADQWIIK